MTGLLRIPRRVRHELKFRRARVEAVEQLTPVLKRIVLTGSTLRSRPADEKARLAASVEATVWPWVASGAVRAQVEATFHLTEAAAAHAHLEAGAHVGKVVLLP
jgi:NADPH:quinone reductase-like Zn-dependent oxidoreductase